MFEVSVEIQHRHMNGQRLKHRSELRHRGQRGDVDMQSEEKATPVRAQHRVP